MLEAISGLVGVIIGSVLTVIIGSVLTYLFSKRNLKQQFETEQAYEFISTKYLPLLNAMLEYEFSLSLLEESNKPQVIPLTYQNALKICHRNLIQLKEALDRIIKSGTHLILNNLDNELGKIIFNLYNRIDIITIFEEKEKVELSEEDIHLKNYDDFKKRILKISIKELVKEYQNLLKE
jgi:hypothetical protein